jgi:hypothetical protein
MTRAVRRTNKPCAFIAEGSRVGSTCPALAIDGSLYCAVHGEGQASTIRSPSSRTKRDLTADVLPWHDGDTTIFHAAEVRREEERSARLAMSGRANRRGDR